MSRLRVVYYTRPSYLDTALPFIRELSRLAEVHLLLELSPEAWSSGLFDVPPRRLPPGVQPADPELKGCFPASVRAYWQDAASFSLVVHNSRGSINLATWWVSQSALRFIRRLKPHVVHLDDVSLRLGLAQPHRLNAPVVLGLHDPEPHSGEHNWRTDLARWLMFGRARKFILHNEALKEPFCQRYRLPSERVAVIPLGVLDIFREWASASASMEARHNGTVLFFGRLSAYKGLEVLYQAAPRVAEQVPGVRFVVAGRPMHGYQPPQPPAMPNQGRVELIGEYISNARLAELFRQASVVACPYVDATQSGVVLTAYAFGKPLLATRVGGLPEYVAEGETGLLVPPSDPESLAAALVRLLTDRALQGRLQEGIERLKGGQLDWRRIAQRTLDLYASVLEH